MAVAQVIAPDSELAIARGLRGQNPGVANNRHPAPVPQCFRQPCGFRILSADCCRVGTFPDHGIELPQVCRARQRAAVDIALTESGAEVGTAVLESAYLAVNIK
jgi:hypothetical protein